MGFSDTFVCTVFFGFAGIDSVSGFSQTRKSVSIIPHFSILRRYCVLFVESTLLAYSSSSLVSFTFLPVAFRFPEFFLGIFISFSLLRISVASCEVLSVISVVGLVMCAMLQL
jgi:hypothetical protein